MKRIPITRPTLEPYAAYAPLFRESIESGMLTTNKHGALFEKKTAAYLGVKYTVAVASCTSGLMLVLKGLNLKGEVILPSFTFCASGHPLLWNNLTPVFADIDPKTYTIDPASVERLITPRTSAILATHVFGAMADVKKLEALAKKYNLKLIFDSAHAFGSSYHGKPAGVFGDAEVFSCSPTKVLTAGEGGIIATNNEELATYCRLGRNYGDDGTYNTLFAGLNARLSELNAAVGLRSFAKFKTNLATRKRKALYMKKALEKIEPNLGFQYIPENTETTYKDLSISVDESKLGYTRDELFDHLSSVGITTRKYFYPPLHEQDTYKKYAPKKGALPVTDLVASRVLSLPLYTHITKKDMDTVIRTFRDWNARFKRS